MISRKHKSSASTARWRQGRAENVMAGLTSEAPCYPIPSTETESLVLSNGGLHCLILLAQKPGCFMHYPHRVTTPVKSPPAPPPFLPSREALGPSFCATGKGPWFIFLKYREIAQMQSEVPVSQKGHRFPPFC